jgi:murein DD-endopeptidase MepM/ murein hydrolase activator NlpD
MIPLPRTARYKIPLMRGSDIDGHGRALHRYLADEGGNLAAYWKQPETVRRTYGIGKRTLAKKAARKAGLPEYGMVGENLYAKMRAAGAYDALADKLLLDYMKVPAPTLVFPITNDFQARIPTFIHVTGGISGNYAMDWMAPHGTAVLAPEAGTVTRLAGHDPASGLHGANRDVFGWSVYLRCKGGFYYGTHMGALDVRAGSVVKAGEILGWVGGWPYDPGRSHLHLGYSSFTRIASVSRNKIIDVAHGPRVQGFR